MKTQNKKVSIEIICYKTGGFGAYVPTGGTAKIIHIHFNMGTSLSTLEDLRKIYRDLNVNFSHMETGHIHSTENGFVMSLLPDPNGYDFYKDWQREFIARDMRLVFHHIQKTISPDDFLILIKEFIEELLNVDWDNLLKQRIFAAMLNLLSSYPEGTINELRLFLESFNL